MLDTKIETETGFAYCESDEITLVGAPFFRQGHKPAFAVGLRSGHTIHALETRANLDAMKKCAAKGFIDTARKFTPAPAPAASSSAGPTKRGRGRPRKWQTVPATTNPTLEAQHAADRRATTTRTESPHVKQIIAGLEKRKKEE